jgi:hypothetical protein
MKLRKPKGNREPKLADAEAEYERAFDIGCVKSALLFYNQTLEGESRLPPDKQNDLDDHGSADDGSRSPGSAFDWLPEALKERAELGDMMLFDVPDEIRPLSDADSESVRSQFDLALKVQRKWASMSRSDRNFISPAIDATLKLVHIHQRLRFIDGEPVRVTLPILRDVNDCMIYALFIIFEDRWGLAGRIRQCRYVGPGQAQAHWFLDYRLDGRGHLKRGTPLEFCSPEHANRFHQREWRKRHAGSKKSKRGEKAERHRRKGG